MGGSSSTWVKPRSRRGRPERGANLVPAEPPVRVLGRPEPRTEVDLVDREPLRGRGVALGRASIHSSSAHECDGWNTTEAVPGGGSDHREGSAFSRSVPSAPRTSSLYGHRGRPPVGTAPRPQSRPARIGWLRPSHPFQSPTTRTACAAGAHTENAVPAAPSCTIGRAPSISHSRRWSPLGEEVRVELPDGRPEPVRIVEGGGGGAVVTRDRVGVAVLALDLEQAVGMDAAGQHAVDGDRPRPRRPDRHDVVVAAQHVVGLVCRPWTTRAGPASPRRLATAGGSGSGR